MARARRVAPRSRPTLPRPVAWSLPATWGSPPSWGLPASWLSPAAWAAYSPWSVLGPWLRLQRLWWQIAWAAPQVVMLRTQDLAQPPWTWSGRQHAEAARMVLEKAGALRTGLAGAGRVLAGGSPTDPALTARAATAGLAPAHRRVGANLARLRRRPRKVAR